MLFSAPAAVSGLPPPYPFLGPYVATGNPLPKVPERDTLEQDVFAARAYQHGYILPAPAARNRPLQWLERHLERSFDAVAKAVARLVCPAAWVPAWVGSLWSAAMSESPGDAFDLDRLHPDALYELGHADSAARSASIMAYLRHWRVVDDLGFVDRAFFDGDLLAAFCRSRDCLGCDVLTDAELYGVQVLVRGLEARMAGLGRCIGALPAGDRCRFFYYVGACTSLRDSLAIASGLRACGALHGDFRPRDYGAYRHWCASPLGQALLPGHRRAPAPKITMTALELGRLLYPLPVYMPMPMPNRPSPQEPPPAYSA